MSLHIQAALPYPAAPRFLFSSLLHQAGAVITGESGVDPAHPASNLAQWEPWRQYQASNATSIGFYVDLGSAASANTLALLGSNISGKSLTVYRSDNGGDWTGLYTLTPTDDQALWVAFLGDSARYWRVTIATGGDTDPVIIRSAALGTALVLESGLRPGAELPPTLAEWEAETQNSVQGVLLGRSVRHQPWQADIALPAIAEAWALDNLPALLEHLETLPAFWCPDATTWPWAALAYLREPASLTYSAHGEIDLTLPLAGISA